MAELITHFLVKLTLQLNDLLFFKLTNISATFTANLNHTATLHGYSPSLNRSQNVSNEFITTGAAVALCDYSTVNTKGSYREQNSTPPPTMTGIN